MILILRPDDLEQILQLADGHVGPFGEERQLAVATGVATSVANTGANAQASAVSGDTGDAINVTNVRATGGDGGRGGTAFAVSGTGGSVSDITVAAGGAATGGAVGGGSIALADASGGAGGRVGVTVVPTAISGDSDELPSYEERRLRKDIRPPHQLDRRSHPTHHRRRGW